MESTKEERKKKKLKSVIDKHFVNDLCSENHGKSCIKMKNRKKTEILGRNST